MDISTEKPQPNSTKPHINIWVLSATSFLTDISSEMLVNLLPLFLANILGVGTVTIGLIEGLAETTASLVKVASGGLSDRIGKRKPLAVLGYGLSTLAKPFLYFATTWIWVLGVRFVDRIGKGIRTAPRDALLASSVSEKHRGLAFGLHRAADTAGAFVGLGITTLIIWQMQSGTSQLTRPAFQWVVMVSFIPALAAVIVLALGAKDVPVSSTSQAQPQQSGLIHWKQIDRRFYQFLVVMVLFTLGNSADAFIILRGQERGLSVLWVMGMLLTFTAVYALISSPAGALSDRIGRRKVILVGWAVYAAVYLGLALAQKGWQVWVLFGTYGIYYALTEGTAKALVADLVPDRQRGSAYGLFNAAIGLVALPASLLAGILWQGLGTWDGLGASAPFYFGFGMAFLAALLFWLWIKIPTKPTGNADNGTDKS
jgi:MFS family permease